LTNETSPLSFAFFIIVWRLFLTGPTQQAVRAFDNDLEDFMDTKTTSQHFTVFLDTL
jgi:hypothetical protein